MQIEMPLTTLRVLLFGDERLAGLKPVSTAPGDIAKVLVIPSAIGQQLVKVDPNEELFHVEFIESDFMPHAEIWLAFEWKESNTRQTRIKDGASQRRIVHERTNEQLREIMEKLRPFGFDKEPGFLEHLAKEVQHNWKSGHLTETLRLFNLLETLQRQEQENKE